MAMKDGRLSRNHKLRPAMMVVLMHAFVLILVTCGRAPDVVVVARAQSGDASSEASPICAPGAGHVEVVRRLWPNEWGAPHPLSLAYSLERAHLALSADAGKVVVITPYEDEIAAVNIPFGLEGSVDLAFDDTIDTLLLLDTARIEIGRLAVGPDGAPDPETLARFALDHLDLQMATGMAVDAATRTLWLLDGGASQLVRADLDPPHALQATVSLPDLEGLMLRELAVHPSRTHLFTVAPEDNELYELTQEGTLLNVYDLTPLQLVDVRGIGFGPSADLTDDPDTIHLYLADSNLVQGMAPATTGTLGQVFGSILEVALIPDFSDECSGAALHGVGQPIYHHWS